MGRGYCRGEIWNFIAVSEMSLCWCVKTVVSGTKQVWVKSEGGTVRTDHTG